MASKNKYLYFVFFLIILSINNKSFAQSLKYGTNQIPDSLRNNANSVRREKTKQFIVTGFGTATLNEHEVITVLNSKAKNNLVFMRYSDKFRKLENANIIVYDSNGVKINSYSQKEMSISGYGEGLVDDGKYTYFVVTAVNYPITVELNATTKFKGILRYPYEIFQDKDQSVQSSTTIITLPKSFGFRYKELNGKFQFSRIDQGVNETYKWEVKNLPVKNIEYNAGPAYLYLPIVLYTANKFEMDNNPGDLSSWKNYGRWYYDLTGNANTLSAEDQDFYKNLVQDKNSTLEKAKAIYDYMQENMRYVSIQLGIGGLKPFPASFVNTKKYGDCKALSNYMQAALSAVGIKSYVALTNGGTPSWPIFNSFPMEAFNHVILCIPQQKDSIWLECTSNNTDFGVLGAFTENHQSLLITENGGQLVRAPQTKKDENIKISKNIIHLKEDGSALVNCSFENTGEFKQEAIANLFQQRLQDIKDYYLGNLKFKTGIDSIEVKEGRKHQIPYPVNSNFYYSQYPDFLTGSKFFISSRPYRIFTEDIRQMKNRTQDFYFKYPYTIIDTSVLKYPKGFTVEQLPSGLRESKPFASYMSEYILDTAKNEISVITQFSIKQIIVKNKDYEELESFAEKVYADMRQKLVLDNNAL